MKTCTSILKGTNKRPGIPCQDFVAIRKSNDGRIHGAIADGLGSLDFSDIAAKTAVERTLDWLETYAFYENLEQIKEKNFKPALIPLVQKAVEEAALSNPGVKAKHLGEHIPLRNLLDCNLAFVTVFPDRKCAIIGQLGDNAVAYACGSHDHIFTTPYKGIGTDSIFSSDPEKSLTMSLLGWNPGEKPSFILMTDGLEDYAYKKGFDWLFKEAENLINPVVLHNAFEARHQLGEVIKWIRLDPFNLYNDVVDEIKELLADRPDLYRNIVKEIDRLLEASPGMYNDIIDTVKELLADSPELSDVIVDKIMGLLEDRPDFSDDISLAVITDAEKANAVELKENPYWKCSCGEKNSIRWSVCSCGLRLIDTYKVDEIGEFPNFIRFFEHYNDHPEEWARKRPDLFPKPAVPVAEPAATPKKTNDDPPNEIHREGALPDLGMLSTPRSNSPEPKVERSEPVDQVDAIFDRFHTRDRNPGTPMPSAGYPFGQEREAPGGKANIGANPPAGNRREATGAKQEPISHPRQEPISYPRQEPNSRPKQDPAYGSRQSAPPRQNPSLGMAFVVDGNKDPNANENYRDLLLNGGYSHLQKNPNATPKHQERVGEYAHQMPGGARKPRPDRYVEAVPPEEDTPKSHLMLYVIIGFTGLLFLALAFLAGLVLGRGITSGSGEHIRTEDPTESFVDTVLYEVSDNWKEKNRAESYYGPTSDGYPHGEGMAVIDGKCWVGHFNSGDRDGVFRVFSKEQPGDLRVVYCRNNEIIAELYGDPDAVYSGDAYKISKGICNLRENANYDSSKVGSEIQRDQIVRVLYIEGEDPMTSWALVVAEDGTVGWCELNILAECSD